MPRERTPSQNYQHPSRRFVLQEGEEAILENLNHHSDLTELVVRWACTSFVFVTISAYLAGPHIRKVDLSTVGLQTAT